MPDDLPHLLRRNTFWIRAADNPVFPLGGEGSPDQSSTMNPCILRVDDQWWMYYAGGDAAGHRQICLATTPVDQPGAWTRHGVVLPHGNPGDFDARWTVIPNVIRVADDDWRLYYTGNCGVGKGLAAFPGIGVATSTDGKSWTRHPGNPILRPSGKAGDPDAVGMGGGSVLIARLPDRTLQWRMYYTACPTVGDNVFLDQQKRVALAVSDDGFTWEKRGAVMLRHPDHDYEDIAVATPVVSQEPDGSYRMWYSAIGTRWGFYSICYAESDDGLTWRRGEGYGDNLQLGPAGQGWERQMVQYPAVVREQASDRLRLFYNGNGYGSTGTGTATACPLRATGMLGPSTVTLVSEPGEGAWTYRMPEGLMCDEGIFKVHDDPIVSWRGPTSDGRIWHEYHFTAEDQQRIAASDALAQSSAPVLHGLHYRVTLRPIEQGLEIRWTVTNTGGQTLHNVYAFPCLGRPDPAWRDPDLKRSFVVTAEGPSAIGELDRGTGDPRRTHYHVEGMPRRRWTGEWFWGQASAATIAGDAGGAIARAREDGAFAIATGWQRVTALAQNEDAHHCLHSCPTVGDLAPGETRSILGWIVLTLGDAACALATLDQLRRQHDGA